MVKRASLFYLRIKYRFHMEDLLRTLVFKKKLGID